MARACRLGLLCLLVSVPASAQPHVHTGTLLEFFHGVDQFALTMKYQLCVDAVTDAACRDVTVSPSTVTGWYAFPLPASVTAGSHYLGVRAVGFGVVGPTGVSNALQVVVNPPPGTLTAPSLFRIVPE